MNPKFFLDLSRKIGYTIVVPKDSWGRKDFDGDPEPLEASSGADPL